MVRNTLQDRPLNNWNILFVFLHHKLPRHKGCNRTYIGREPAGLIVACHILFCFVAPSRWLSGASYRYGTNPHAQTGTGPRSNRAEGPFSFRELWLILYLAMTYGAASTITRGTTFFTSLFSRESFVYHKILMRWKVERMILSPSRGVSVSISCLWYVTF